MNAPREVSAARRWLEQAAEDLATARRLVDDGESPTAGMVCFPAA